MYCHNCGSNIQDGSAFCPDCGAAQDAAAKTAPDRQENNAPGQTNQTPVEAYAQPDQAYQPQLPDLYNERSNAPAGETYRYAYTNEMATAPTRRKRGLWWKVAVPVIAVVLAAAAVYYFFFLRDESDIVGTALANVSAETVQRLDGTPLKAFGLLADTLKNGTVTVNFDYEDTWYGDKTSGSLSLTAIPEEREFAITGDIGIYDAYWEDNQNFEFEAFLNKERVAIGSPILGNNYFGIKYDTFRDDIKTIGSLVGLDQSVMDQLSDVVEMLGEALNAEPPENIEDNAYAALLEEFYGKCVQTSERLDISSGGKTVKATKIDIAITKETIASFLESVYDLIESDENIRAAYDQISEYMDMDGSSYESILRDLRSGLRSFDESYSDANTITITLYIGEGERLLLLEADADLLIDGERTSIGVSFDFGASATDRWVFAITADGETVTMTWDCKERANSIENVLTISHGSDTFTLVSDWSQGKGDFVITYRYPYRYEDAEDASEWAIEGELTGELREDANGFTLYLDNALLDPNDGAILKVEIIGEYGASIKQIEYVNLDRWIEHMFEIVGGLSNAGIDLY